MQIGKSIFHQLRSFSVVGNICDITEGYEYITIIFFSLEDHPMTNFVEATNCHHHYIWQATHHASEGDAVYVDNDEQMDSHELVYHDHASTTENQNDSDEFRVESDDVSDVDEENEEHFLDHSHDETDSFFASHRQSRGGGGGTRGGGPMVLPGTGRIER